MSELPPPRFRKTKSGTWAVMGPVETLEAALASDGKVEVAKRSGDTSSFTVVSLGKPFDVDGVQMCYGYADDGDGGGGGGAQAPGQSQRASAPNTAAKPAASAPRGPAAAREALAKATTPEPDRDPHEPLPEWQGGAEDEWHGEF